MGVGATLDHQIEVRKLDREMQDTNTKVKALKCNNINKKEYTPSELGKVES